ncbi:hypothetical protein D1872_305960 [compost metagenome]
MQINFHIFSHWNYLEVGVDLVKYIAHIRKSDLENQWVEEHLIGVKKLAETIGNKLNISHITGLASAAQGAISHLG